MTRMLELTGVDLKGANLTGTDLRRADLTEANLTGANLRRANLTGANLTGTDLTGANLTGAVLTGANLMGAVLKGAVGLKRPVVYESRGGWLYAYKAVTLKRTGPTFPGLHYGDGETVSVDGADTSEALCGSGVNVATLDWCRKNHPGPAIVKVRFRKVDIASIPYASDGKFRLHRCTVVGEVR
jgi:uncharacterized protein YjbI with pentapeptide repeats